MIKLDFHNKCLTKLNHDQEGHMKESVFIVVILKADKGQMVYSDQDD